METFESLLKKVETIDNQDYGACQSLRGKYQFPTFVLCIDHIPKDPFAPPHTGLYRLQIDLSRVVPDTCDIASSLRKTAFRDFLTRRFFNISQNISGKRRGTGYSGIITIDQPGQAILDRSSIVINNDLIEVRCFVGLPAKGRKINGKLAKQMLSIELQKIVESSLFKSEIDADSVNTHLNTFEDAEFLRKKLDSDGLLAFIANESVLPRESGTSDKPLAADKAVKIMSPDSMQVTFDLPYYGKVKGMGIKKGVSLIVGGGYHGKSTLLNAIEQGIYSHIPGDGREWCVSSPDAVKVRAYSGRNVEKTDISCFIRNLPFQKDTTSFTTENASGSTSQAANIIEAIEIGTKVLLMDEDTCAANFMIRDEKMQKLVQKSDEPITAFIDRIRQLYTEKGISTILVLGGVGDYFAVADQVIQMIKYTAVDVSKLAEKIISESPKIRESEDEAYPIDPKNRIPLVDSITSLNEYGKDRIYATEVRQINFGKYKIDLTDLEQLNELSQTKAIAFAMNYAKKYMDGKNTLNEVVESVINDIKEKNLNVIDDRISGHFAMFRKYELAFVINRMRGLKVKQE